MSTFIKDITAKNHSAAITLIICLISITPLCGYIFQCGCDWPGLGMDAKCNIHDAMVEHQCPWCKSLVMGLFSSSFATVAGVMVASDKLNLIHNENNRVSTLMRIVFGVFVFFLIAILLAKLAALWHGYPI